MKDRRSTLGPLGIERRSFAALRMTLLTIALVSLAACSDDGANDNFDSAPKVTPTSSAPPIRTPPIATSPAGSPDATPQPTPGRVSDEPVAFQTDDGVTLRGHLYSSPGPQRRAVILAHAAEGDQRTWREFAMEVAGLGIASLTFDFRGYGETGGSKDVAGIERDLAAALLFMQSRDYPLIYLAGMEMGGNAALKVAATQEVSGVIAVSPSLLMGLDISADVPHVREPALLLASRESGEAQLRQILALAPQMESFTFEGNAEGTALLQGSNAASFKEQIVQFLQR